MSDDRAGSAAWRRLSSTLAHRGPYFDLRLDEVIRPDGSRGTYEHVVTRGGVTVLAMDSDGDVVLTRQWIYTHGDEQWRLPSGGIDPSDRDAETAARRELAEETGLQAATWRRIGQVSGADSFTNHMDHVFLAEDLTPGRPEREPGEADLRVIRIPFADVVEMVLGGEMPHAGSAYAVLVAAASRTRH